MTILDVRRSAAVDMHGLSGSQRRERIIRVEFWAGAVGCSALGILSLVFGHGLGRMLGVWLIGVGLNCLPLALSSQSLSRAGALESELEGVDIPAEARKLGVQQLWILVPLAVVIRPWTPVDATAEPQAQRPAVINASSLVVVDQFRIVISLYMGNETILLIRLCAARLVNRSK